MSAAAGARPNDEPSRWQVPPIGESDADIVSPTVEEDVEHGRHVVGAVEPVEVTTVTSDRPTRGLQKFTWVSAHGGAGASSLAAATGLGHDLTKRWPAVELGWPREVAVVCRYNAAGLSAAAALVREVASGAVSDVQVLALVVVADSSSKPTKTLRRRLHEISGTVPTVVHVPWIPAWREVPYTSHRAATKAADAVSALASTPTSKEKS